MTTTREANRITKPYLVAYWGSHPDDENDDCWTCWDFDSREEAEAAYADDNPTYGNGHPISGWAFVELDGPDVHAVRQNPSYDAAKARREAEAEDRAWRREIAMQAGMAFGCDGFNDEMGY